MQVRLLVAFAGPTAAWAAGDVYDCDEAAARRLIAAGYAVPVSVGVAPVVVETAEAAPPPESAIRHRGKRKA